MKNEIMVFAPRKGNPTHLDEFIFTIKKNKLVGYDFQDGAEYAKLNMKSKNKLVWKGKKSYGVKWLNGIYKFKKKVD